MLLLSARKGSPVIQEVKEKDKKALPNRTLIIRALHTADIVPLTAS